MSGKWDRRFLDLAAHVAGWSKDPSTKVAAVIVRPDRTIASLGYNGFPRGCDDRQSLYENREIKYARIIHAEMNAILSSREPLKGYTLYIHPVLSCERCAVHIIQAGIVRVVAAELPASLRDRWGASLATTKKLYTESGVEFVEVSSESV